MTVPVKTYEPGHTVQFTWTSSVAPDAAPRFRVLDASSTVIASFAAVSSTSTAYYALFTMPASGEARYVAEFRALKTIAGSAYASIVRQPFRVLETTHTG